MVASKVTTILYMNKNKIIILRKKLEGTWQIVAWKKKSSESADESNVFGPNPTGYINYAPDGRMMVLLLHGDRVRPCFSPATDTEKINLYDTMLAYTGTYIVEEDRVVHSLDASWNELWKDTIQVRFFSFIKGQLIYKTPLTIDPIDGKSCIYRIILEKLVHSKIKDSYKT